MNVCCCRHIMSASRVRKVSVVGIESINPFVIMTFSLRIIQCKQCCPPLFSSQINQHSVCALTDYLSQYSTICPRKTHRINGSSMNYDYPFFKWHSHAIWMIFPNTNRNQHFFEQDCGRYTLVRPHWRKSILRTPKPSCSTLAICRRRRHAAASTFSNLLNSYWYADCRRRHRCSTLMLTLSGGRLTNKSVVVVVVV